MGHLLVHGLAQVFDALRVDIAFERFGHFVFVWQAQHQCLEGWVQAGVAQHAAQGRQDRCIQNRCG